MAEIQPFAGLQYRDADLARVDERLATLHDVARKHRVRPEALPELARLEKALFLLRKELDLNALKEKITHQIEERITKPMEKLLWEIKGVEYIYSIVKPGFNLTIVRFYVGQSMEDSIVNLNNKLSANYDRIPPGVLPPLIKQRSIDDVPILDLPREMLEELFSGLLEVHAGRSLLVTSRGCPRAPAAPRGTSRRGCQSASARR